MTIRILVAEDSPTARALLVAIFREDPELEVIGEAIDGIMAVRMAKSLRPDVITMDLNMPGLDGFEAIRRIMAEAPVPIVVVSGSMERDQIASSVRALSVGALTVLHRPRGPGHADFDEQRRQMLAAVKSLAEVRVVRRRQPTLPRSVLSAPRPAGTPALIAIAASTGGPAALHRILSDLSGTLHIPLLIVQHIAVGFGTGLVDWLNSASTRTVKLAETGERALERVVYVAPDERHLGIAPDGTLIISAAKPIGGHRPSGTFLFESVAHSYGSRAIAIILTGMGRDGVDGLRAVRQSGGQVIAQDEESSVVFGMPAAAISAGVVDVVLPLASIAPHLARSLEVPRAR
ncbi:MAG TPA: chemotaxis-specific protein-glutamate methyltransferase CheB [Polyangiaceae bacterium]|nr:chemotaxis-specific protein-glutamate methyltransferase CheB [Polyangiaceae bacterium]